MGAPKVQGRIYNSKMYKKIYRMGRGHSNFYDWRTSRYYDSYLTEAHSLLYNVSSLNVSTFSIDEATNRLFFAQGSSIRVINHDLSKNVTLKRFVRVAIADSRITKAVRALAVHGNLVIWSSSELDGLFVGVLSKGGSFISSKNVLVMDGEKNMNPRRIAIVNGRTEDSVNDVLKETRRIQPEINFVTRV